MGPSRAREGQFPAPVQLGPNKFRLFATPCPWNFSGRTLEWVAIAFSRDLPNPGIETVPSALAGRFFTTEPPGKPHIVRVP